MPRLVRTACTRCHSPFTASTEAAYRRGLCPGCVERAKAPNFRKYDRRRLKARGR